MAFKKTVEDFVCDKCGHQVTGTGYTNHCPSCLWSKHVDVSPGDRTHPCQGRMRPLRLEGSTDKYRIVHECTRCFATKVNSVGPDDSLSALIALAQNGFPTLQ